MKNDNNLIITENTKPELNDFAELMRKTDALLNEDAVKRPSYYRQHGGLKLEKIVLDAMVESAINTPFQGTIHLVSGRNFPDIAAAKYFGTEVKSTKKDSWQSVGSSINESTRLDGVERIYLTFGKLGGTPKFLSKPYESCLSGISVTHYPRYHIDMGLNPRDTIFSKMDIPYDSLRTMDNPVEPVSKYYKSHLKPGERLWWAGDNSDPTEGLTATLKLYSVLNKEEKDRLVIKGLAFFPEIATDLASNSKYNRFTLWLVTNESVVNGRVRDMFSAGGKVPFTLSSGITVKVAKIYDKIRKNKNQIIDTINEASEEELKDTWDVEHINDNRLEQWISLVISQFEDPEKRSFTSSVLRTIFFGHG